MNILIICTYYPPYTGIAAIRPYMFSKYLAKKGHNVTVLCPNDTELDDDRLLSCRDLGVQMCCYMQKTDGYTVQQSSDPTAQSPKKLSFLPENIRKPLKKIYYGMRKPVQTVIQYRDVKKRLRLMKACIDSLQSQKFDVVFATYSELENIFAGRYAAEKLKCKWIMDFRDPVAQRRVHGWLRYPLLRKLERKTIQSADICTAVSHGVADLMAEGTGKSIVTLYNGYDAAVDMGQDGEMDDVLRFVYTGALYYGEQSFEALFRALRHLQEADKLDIQKVCLEYAGPHFEMLAEQAKRYDLETILVNHGYLDRKAVTELQKKCDVYLVLSWNTKDSKGVLTGKFYEGIRAHKPILSLVTGEVPNSELLTLNETYRYGFCYEECAGETGFAQLCQWIEEAYRNRCNGKPIPYNPEKALFEVFRYDNLTDKLEKICLDLLKRR